MNNAHVAQVFERIAFILSLLDENPFRIRAYERAAQTILSLSEDLEMIFMRKGTEGLTALPGIGSDLAGKIEELLKTGKLAALAELEKQVPQGLLPVMEIEGVGPKRAKFLWKQFHVESVDDLEKLAASGSLSTVKGWGEKSVQNLLLGIKAMRLHHERVALPAALGLAEQIVARLEECGLCGTIAIAGSLRRRKESVGDIDILATSAKPLEVMEVFCAFPLVDRVLAKGETKSSVHLSTGIDADLRVVEEKVFGAALHYFTGSKEHNIAIRKLGIEKGLTISEYGVYEGTAKAKGKLLASRTEEDVYRAVGLPMIDPELREDRGEIAAARAGTLPALVTLGDLKGDLHVHSTFSDGNASMLDMALAAKEAGLAYIIFCDHASPMGMVRGIKEDTIAAYLRDIDDVRRQVQGIEIIAGAEVDILEDGSLYLEDELLARLQWVTASLHSHFKMASVAMTKRILRVLSNPHVRVLGHPTARLLLRRDPVQYDMDAVMEAAAERGVALEINASVFRLDLNDILAKRAKTKGVKIAISSDAHHPREFDLRFGVSQARRAWLAKEDVINTLPYEKFASLLTASSTTRRGARGR